ncbi:hypothetical protein Tco_0123575 [Tanacetum coccineum]
MGILHGLNLDYVELIWDEFKYQITRRRKKAKKAEKLPYARFIKLIIDYHLSHNNTIKKRSYAYMHSESQDEKFKQIKLAKKGVMQYGMQIPETMLNDTIKEMEEYKEYFSKGKRVVVPMKGAFVAKEVKETYVDDPDQMHVTTLLSIDSERQRLEGIRQQKLMIEEEIDDEVADTLESIKTLKLKRMLGNQREGSKIRKKSQDDRDFIDSDQTPSTRRLDNVVNEGDEDDVSNYSVFVHDKEKEAKEKEIPIFKPLSPPRTGSFHDDVSCYLNENLVPSLRDVGLLRTEGTSGLNSHYRSSRKEKPCGDSVDLDRLPESQTVIVPEVTMTKPTMPNQHGSIVVNPKMHLTP